mmetsp:Transcript_21338/g.48126  ORF Transcript_21338/g.48126 Transcript_21338/m.48126 type:complete len:102 (+) Transcript_21338:111-416(+)
MFLRQDDLWKQHSKRYTIREVDCRGIDCSSQRPVSFVNNNREIDRSSQSLAGTARIEKEPKRTTRLSELQADRFLEKQKRNRSSKSIVGIDRRNRSSKSRR